MNKKEDTKKDHEVKSTRVDKKTNETENKIPDEAKKTTAQIPISENPTSERPSHVNCALSGVSQYI